MAEQWGTPPSPRLLRAVRRLVRWRRPRLLHSLIQKARTNGEYLFEHLGHLPKEFAALGHFVSLDPVTYVPDSGFCCFKDKARVAWCGDSVRVQGDSGVIRVPVTHRSDLDYVFAGVAGQQLPSSAWMAGGRPRGRSRTRERALVVWQPPRAPSRRRSRSRSRQGPRGRSRRRSRTPSRSRSRSSRPSRNWFARKAYGGPIPGVDWAMHSLQRLAAPKSGGWSDDPRHRSRNLGRVIDGVTGWAADLGMSLPIVWPVTGYGLRFLAHCVRGLEDVLNAGTGVAGVQLFIIMLCLLPVPMDSAPTKACRLPDRTWTLSNVCTQADLRYCTSDMCWHSPGCYVATDICWTQYSPTLSHHPDRASPLTLFADHLDIFSVVVYGCEVSGAGEVCGVTLVILDLLVEYFPRHVETNCSMSCGLSVDAFTITTALDGLLESNAFLDLMAMVLKQVPWLIGMLFTEFHMGILFVSMAYLIEGKAFRVVMLLGLYATLHSAVAAPCDLTLRYHSCFTPHLQHVFNKTPVARMRGKCINPEGQPCDIGKQPCVGMGDNFTVSPKLTLAACHFGRNLSRCVSATNTSAGEKPDGKIRFKRIPLPVTCICKPDRLSRMPGSPYYQRRKFPWFPLWGVPVIAGRDHIEAFVCPGHAFAIGDATQGRLALASETSQVFTGLPKSHLFSLFERSVFLFCLLQFMGARLVGLVYLLWVMGFAEASVDFSAPVALATAPLIDLAPWLAVAVWVLLMYGSRPLSLALGVVLQVFYGQRLSALLAVAVLLLTRNSALGDDGSYNTPAINCWAAVGFIFLLTWVPFWRFRVWRVKLAWVVFYLREVFYATLEALFKSPPTTLVYPVYALLVWCAGCAGYAPYCLYAITCCSVVDALFYCALHYLLPVDRNRLIEWCCKFCIKLPLLLERAVGTLLVWRLSAYRVYVYDHLTPLGPAMRTLALDIRAATDPFVFPTAEVKYIHDSAVRYACGDCVGGLPVVARRGASVLLGVPLDGIPPHYNRCAPVTTKVMGDDGIFTRLKVCITGRDSTTHSGQVCILKTMLSSSMGYGCNGILFTTSHGSRARSMAAEGGARNPLSDDSQSDITCYRLPKGMSCLQQCTCMCRTGFLVAKDGGTYPVTHREDEVWALDSPTPLSLLRGSSGGPVVCPQGHAIGTFRAAGVRGGVGVAAHVVPVRMPEGAPGPMPTPENCITPTPTAQFSIKELVAPTGSGKSTRVPADYISAGHTVLVLNPSVATTAAMPGYMHSKYGLSPNWHCGNTSVITGSPLTYSTYGKMLAIGKPMFEGVNIIICDECHATDATTVLGIAVVLSEAESMGVKTVILATATPPGTHMAPHPQITEVPLGTDGDIPFYGSSLKSTNYKSGRHLVFCDTKKQCVAIADSFTALGIEAVTFWRGKDVSVIKAEGDIVVVATNALMTGYTGNFQTVTDCCTEVVSNAEIDFQPTITISVRSQLASVVTRLQRRGRTGRGAPGTYFFALKQHGQAGIVPLSTVMEVYDSGMAWYTLAPARITQLLGAYALQPLLPCITTELTPVQDFYTSMIRAVTSPNVARAKQQEVNYPLLTGSQVDFAQERGYTLPVCDRYKGYGVPLADKDAILLYNLDGPTQHFNSDNTRVLELMGALGVVQLDMSLVAGLALAAGLCSVAVIADSLGSIMVTHTFHVCMQGQRAPVHEDPGLSLQECVEGVDLSGALEITKPLYDRIWEAASQHATAASTAVGAAAAPHIDLLKTKTAEIADIAAKHGAAAAAYCKLHGTKALDWLKELRAGSVPPVPELPLPPPPPPVPFGTQVLGFLAEHGPKIMAAAQVLGGFTILGTSPAMGGAMLGTGFFLLPRSLPGRFFMAMLAGGLGTWLSTPAGGFAAALGSFAGIALADSGFCSIFQQALTTYMGATTAASIVFDLLGGKLPTAQEAVGLFTLIINPGAAVVGCVLAGLLHAYATRGSSEWLNRMLAMAVRGNVLPPGYFVEGETPREKISTLLRSMTPAALLRATLSWTRTTNTVVMADQPHHWLFDYIWGILCGIGRWARTTIATFTQSLEPKIPMFSCTKPYTAGLAGTGKINTLCFCGAALSYSVVDGNPVCEFSSRATCRSYWCKGVPLGPQSVLTGTVSLAPEYPYEAEYPCGLRDRVLIRHVLEGFTVLKSSSQCVYHPISYVPNLRRAIKVNGAPVTHNESNVRNVADMQWTAGATIRFNHEEIKLPHTVIFNTNYRDEGTGEIPEVEEPPERADVCSEKGGSWSEVSVPHHPRSWGSEDLKPCSPPRSVDPDFCVNRWLNQPITAEFPTEYPSRTNSDPGEGERGRTSPYTGSPAPPSEGIAVIDITSVEQPKKRGGPAIINAAYVQGPPNPIRKSILSLPGSVKRLVRSISSDTPTAIPLVTRQVSDAGDSRGRHVHYGRATGAEDRCHCTFAETGSPAGTVHSKSSLCSPTPSVKRVTFHDNKAFDPGPEEIPHPLDPGKTTDVHGLRIRRFEKTNETWSPMSHSYVWNGTPPLTAWVRKAMNPVAEAAFHLGTKRGALYATDPERIGERIQKVTVWRDSFTETPEYRYFVNLARDRAMGVRERTMTLEEACAATPPRSARSCVTGLTALDIRAVTPDARQAVYDAYAAVCHGVDKDKWAFTTLMPKVEWFVRRPGGSMKAPRLIMYPPLEVRVAEKLLLGRIAPAVCKAVLREEYGFDCTPQERASRLVKWWNTTNNPMVFTADAFCYDSQITPHDMRVEAQIFADGTRQPDAKKDIHGITENLYAWSPVERTDRVVIGARACRASGVLTTSTGNTLTCWIKMKAAMREAGISDPHMIVCGDDCIVVARSEGPECDKDRLEVLSNRLSNLGLRQGDPILPAYSLEAVTTCSAYVTTAYPKDQRNPDYFLSPDPVRTLGRCMVESRDRTAPFTWLSAIVSYYPTYFASRILCVAWLREIINAKKYDADSTLAFEYYGNVIEAPLKMLPYILVHLHGRNVFSYTRYSAKHLGDVSHALERLGYKPIRAWRNEARRVWALCLKEGGTLYFLARHLLWHASGVPPVNSLDRYYLKKVECNSMTQLLPFSSVHVDYGEGPLGRGPSRISWQMIGAAVLVLTALFAALWPLRG
ncbi:polyprotein [Wenling shark virus]|uniref:flavivirus polyprotein n=1 Tax=Wenling shark virus TaxID=1746066 RepID=UPI000706DE0F|nr:flavivirus polyprotein [Wenling shark virus]ALL52891.1 polyprotein [Wenling shark virus]